MKKLVPAVALFVLACSTSSAHAVVGVVDDVAAATLLVPYFEVDLAHPDGANTLFSVNNASATAVLAPTGAVTS